MTVESVAGALTVRESVLGEFEQVSALQGEADPEVLPAFVPQHVLDEAVDLTRKAIQVETGGILIGHLHWDPRVPEVFAVVTAQIPATNAIAELTKLTFTPETWTAVR